MCSGSTDSHSTTPPHINRSQTPRKPQRSRMASRSRITRRSSICTPVSIVWLGRLGLHLQITSGSVPIGIVWPALGHGGSITNSVTPCIRGPVTIMGTSVQTARHLGRLAAPVRSGNMATASASWGSRIQAPDTSPRSRKRKRAG